MLKCGYYVQGAYHHPFVYTILPNDWCVFTSTAPGASSIQSAERIVSAVLRAEDRPRESLRFFDLQTRLGYPHCIKKLAPGDFELDEVIFETGFDAKRLVVKRWKPTRCPPDLSDLFKRYIGGRPRQVNTIEI